MLQVITPCNLWNISFNNETGLCNTVPMTDLLDSQALALEFLATSFLIILVCSVWDPRNSNKPDSVPLKFAVVITVISAVVVS